MGDYNIMKILTKIEKTTVNVASLDNMRAAAIGIGKSAVVTSAMRSALYVWLFDSNTPLKSIDALIIELCGDDLDKAGRDAVNDKYRSWKKDHTIADGTRLLSDNEYKAKNKEKRAAASDKQDAADEKIGMHRVYGSLLDIAVYAINALDVNTMHTRVKPMVDSICAHTVDDFNTALTAASARRAAISAAAAGKYGETPMSAPIDVTAAAAERVNISKKKSIPSTAAAAR